MLAQIEVFYTGGGITLCEAVITEEFFALVGTDAPDVFSIYRQVDEDEERYLPEDMVLSKHKDELDEDQKALYNKMLEALKAKGALD